MGRRRHGSLKIGDYRAACWESKYIGGQYVYSPLKPIHRKAQVKKFIGNKPSDSYPAYTERVWDFLDTQTLIDTDLTVENSCPLSRNEQAVELAHAGYHGPIGGGEARVLKNIFTGLGMPELIKRGWVAREVEVTHKPSRWSVRWATANGQTPPTGRRVQTVRLQRCYLFKSPLENVPFEKWIKLARMYKDGKALRGAVMALLANPDAHKEIDTLDALEILGGMRGME